MTKVDRSPDMLTPPTLDLLPPYAARRSRSQGKTWFVTESGQRFPSVTSILNATKSWEDRQALARWRSRVGQAEAAQITQTASRRGTQTHKRIQRFLQGEADPAPVETDPYWTSVSPVLAQISTVRLVEGTVVHPDLGYAGRVDGIVHYDDGDGGDRLCVVDWKTADRPKGSIERLYDHPLQLAAYCGAANQTYGEQGLNIQQAVIVVAIAGHPAELFWLDGTTLTHYWQQWQQRLTAFQLRFGG